VRVRGALFVLPFEQEGDIDATVYALLKEQRRHTQPLFRTNTVKFFMDGVVEGRTALLESPYEDVAPRHHGLAMWNQEMLKKMVLAVHQAGFQAHFHSIGDRATRLALDALEYSAANGGGSHRDLLTHLQLVRPVDFKRFAALKVIAVPVPQWAVVDDYFPAEVKSLGDARAEHQYPLRGFVDAGVMLASSSDFPASPDPDPLRSIQAGLVRWLPEYGTERVLWPAERIRNRETLFDSFTRNGAYANFLEDETGSIEVGKSADLVVLSDDLTRMDPKTISDATVNLTMLRGDIVWRKAEQ